MVFKLDTLDVMLDFAHGPYRLGDTINANCHPHPQQRHRDPNGVS